MREKVLIVNESHDYPRKVQPPKETPSKPPSKANQDSTSFLKQPSNMKFITFISIAISALLCFVKADEYAHGVSPAIRHQHHKRYLADIATISDMRIRSILPLTIGQRRPLLLRMRSRNKMHLQWLRSMHALEYQQWLCELRVDLIGRLESDGQVGIKSGA